MTQGATNPEPNDILTALEGLVNMLMARNIFVKKYIRIKTISLILKRDLHFCPHNNKVQ